MVDFAYHVHTDVGNQMFGAKVNGKAVHAGHALANAEVVEVLTYDGRPSKGSIARHQVSCSNAFNMTRLRHRLKILQWTTGWAGLLGGCTCDYFGTLRLSQVWQTLCVLCIREAL